MKTDDFQYYYHGEVFFGSSAVVIKYYFSLPQSEAMLRNHNVLLIFFRFFFLRHHALRLCCCRVFGGDARKRNKRRFTGPCDMTRRRPAVIWYSQLDWDMHLQQRSQVLRSFSYDAVQHSRLLGDTCDAADIITRGLRTPPKHLFLAKKIKIKINIKKNLDRVVVTRDDGSQKYRDLTIHFRIRGSLDVVTQRTYHRTVG